MKTNVYKAVGAALLALLASGCGFFGIGGEFLTEFPPEALDIPINDNVDEYSFFHEAVDINESNIVIGYTNSSGAYASAGLDAEMFPVAGFSINADGTGYHDITAAVSGSTASWPLDINDSGVVVGAYIEKLSTDTYALRAYSIHADGSHFVDLHPSNELSTKATHINENGRVFGVIEGLMGTEDEFSEKAVEFTIDGDGNAQTTPLLTDYVYSYVQAVNDTTVVICANETADSSDELLLYTIADGSVEELLLEGIPSEEAIVEAISNDGTMVGWYFDLNEEPFGDVGFTYTIGDESPATYRTKNIIDGWEHIHYRFIDFDSDGTIVGISGRINDEFPFPQSRAMRLEWDFTGFEDITPENGDAYADAYGITDDGWVAGYAGFSFANIFGVYETTRNAGFVTKIK